MSSCIVGSLNLDGFDLKNEIAYLNSLPKIEEEYDEFAQGYWKNISLLNASGEGDDSQFRFCQRPEATEHLRRLPKIRQVINDHFSTAALKMVRARNLIDGMVVPHRDFVEMKEDGLNFFRVFVMLEDNLDSYHSDDSGVFQMKKGEVWFLDAAIEHSAVNFSNKSRMALCFDFVFETDFRPEDIFSTRDLVTRIEPTYRVREALNDAEVESIIGGISALLSRRTFKDLVFTASKYHFTRDVPVAACYDWLIEAANRNADTDTADKAQALKRYLVVNRDLGQRFSISEW